MTGEFRRPTFALILLAASLLPANAHAAGGAYIVDDAEIGKPGDCKVESWASFGGNHDLDFSTVPACVANLGIPVELGAQLQRQRASDVWRTVTGGYGKISIIPVGTGPVGVGLVAGGGWDTANGRVVDSYVYVPLTHDVSETLRFNVNVGWQYDGGARAHYAIWGAGFEWKFKPPLTLIGEIYGYAGPQTDPPTFTSPRAQIGLRVTPVKNIDIDLIYGRNINGENANWLTLGINLRF